VRYQTESQILLKVRYGTKISDRPGTGYHVKRELIEKPHGAAGRAAPRGFRSFSGHPVALFAGVLPVNDPSPPPSVFENHWLTDYRAARSLGL